MVETVSVSYVSGAIVLGRVRGFLLGGARAPSPGSPGTVHDTYPLWRTDGEIWAFFGHLSQGWSSGPCPGPGSGTSGPRSRSSGRVAPIACSGSGFGPGGDSGGSPHI